MSILCRTIKPSHTPPENNRTLTSNELIMLLSWNLSLQKLHLHVPIRCANALFLYPLKTSENLKVFCFQRQRKGALGTNGLINQKFFSEHVTPMLYFYTMFYFSNELILLLWNFEPAKNCNFVN